MNTSLEGLADSSYRSVRIHVCCVTDWNRPGRSDDLELMESVCHHFFSPFIAAFDTEFLFGCTIEQVFLLLLVYDSSEIEFGIVRTVLHAFTIYLIHTILASTPLAFHIGIVPTNLVFNVF